MLSKTSGEETGSGGQGGPDGIPLCTSYITGVQQVDHKLISGEHTLRLFLTCDRALSSKPLCVPLLMFDVRQFGL